MKRIIKINNDMQLTNLICLFVIGLFIIFLVYYITKELPFLLFGVIVLVVGSYFSYKTDIKQQADAVTKIIINNDNLVLVYKNKTIKNISKNNIKSFKVTLNCDEALSYYKFFVTYTKGNVYIGLNDGDDVKFDIFQQFSVGNYICNYKLILFALEQENAIPNFSYTIDGNSQLIKDDIEYYKINKKRLPRKSVYEYELKNASFQRKFVLLMIPVLCILGLLSLIFAIIINLK
jgi:hypothetical protein